MTNVRMRWLTREVELAELLNSYTNKGAFDSPSESTKGGIFFLSFFLYLVEAPALIMRRLPRSLILG